MRMVTLTPAEKPKSFVDAGFTQEEWREATKKGPVKVDFLTAMEAVKYSKGLYSLKAERAPVVGALMIPGLPEPEDMDNRQIAEELAMRGHPLRKKANRTKLIPYLRELRANSLAFIVDDEEEEEEVLGEEEAAKE